MRRLYAPCHWVGGRGPSLDNCQNRCHNSRVASNRGKGFGARGGIAIGGRRDWRTGHRQFELELICSKCKLRNDLHSDWHILGEQFALHTAPLSPLQPENPWIRPLRVAEKNPWFALPLPLPDTHVNWLGLDSRLIFNHSKKAHSMKKYNPRTCPLSFAFVCF